MALRDLFASKLAGPAGRVLDAPIRDIVHELLKEHGYASPAEIQALRDELRDLRTRLAGVDRKVADLVLVAEEARSEAAAARADAVSGLALHAARTPPAADPRVATLEARVAELDQALAAARTTAAAPAPADPRVGALEARVAELEAALAAARVAPSAPAAVPVPEPAAEAPRAAEAAARPAAAAARPAAAAAPAPLSAEPRSACKVGGCTEPVRSKGFCSPHYQQWRRGTLKGCVNPDGTALVDGRVVHLPMSTIGGAINTHDGHIYVDGKRTEEIKPA